MKPAGRRRHQEKGGRKGMLSSILTLNCFTLMGPLKPLRFLTRYFSSETRSRDVRTSLVVWPTKESDDMLMVERERRKGQAKREGEMSPA